MSSASTPIVPLINKSTRKNHVLAPLVWIDLEMTGLNATYDKVLEIATVITNGELEVIASGPHMVIHHEWDVIKNMQPEVMEIHRTSGLIDAVAQSTTTTKDAERATLEFIKAHCPQGLSPLCGNSVWQDKHFLSVAMPSVASYLNYRIIDVSSVKEIVKRWYPRDSAIYFQKPNNHRALEDILFSIEELRHYRIHFFKDPQ